MIRSDSIQLYLLVISSIYLVILIRVLSVTARVLILNILSDVKNNNTLNICQHISQVSLVTNCSVTVTTLYGKCPATQTHINVCSLLWFNLTATRFRQKLEKDPN